MANLETGATDLKGAATRMSALLNGEQEPTPDDGGVIETQPEAPDTSTDDTPEPRYTVKVGDEEREVSLDELRKGYMMESDYRAKTTQVAERKKALDAKEAEIESHLNEAQALIEMELDTLASDEMQELKEIDPDAYLKEFDRINGKVEKFKKAKEKSNEAQAEKQKELAQKEFEALTIAIPEWLDPDVRAKEAAEVFSYLEGIGYSKEELSGLVDHRQFVNARNAMRQVTQGDLDSKEVKTPPKTQQPGVTTSATDRADSKVKTLRANLKKSGHVRDAQALFKSLLE